ncbi:hypothetical protein BH11BAC7_BH11BAC7_22130 [soil metagenome]
MKKVYSTLAAAFVTIGMMAQAPVATQNTHPAPARAQVAADRAVAASIGNNPAPAPATVFHARLSHTDEAINLVDPGNTNGLFSLFVNAVFQDSSVQAVYSNGQSYVTTQKIGGIFDPKSVNHFGANALNSTATYTVDTVWIGGAYEITNASVGDTLQVEIIYGPSTATFWQGLQIGNPPTQVFRLPKNTTSLAMGNMSFSTATSANKVIVKRVLTALDTFSDPNVNPDYPYIAVVPSVPVSVPANNIVGLEATFIPVAPYSAGDIYFSADPLTPATMNSFRGYIYQDAAAGNGNEFFYDGSSWGISGDLDNRSRYGIWPSAQSFLNGSMLPYTEAGYLIDVSITSLTVGVTENNIAGFELGQNSPNPVDGNTTINYSIINGGDVMFNVYDVAGKMVMTVNKGNQVAGTYTIDLNTSTLEAGVYFYTMNVNGTSATRKMIVQ